MYFLLNAVKSKIETYVEVQVKMTNEEYKQARQELGFSVSEWVERLGISVNSHKSYNSSRREIPNYIAAHIETLRELKNNQK